MPEQNQIAKARCYSCGGKVRWKGRWVEDRSMGQTFLGPADRVEWWICEKGHEQPGGFDPDEED